MEMNERIRELAEQAWKEILDETSIDGDISTMFSSDEVVEFETKFAELIVAECMDLALSEQKRYASFTHRNLSECAVTMSNFRLVMKDHFGVEE